jgi:hypothetical protein
MSENNYHTPLLPQAKKYFQAKHQANIFRLQCEPYFDQMCVILGKNLKI